MLVKIRLRYGPSFQHRPGSNRQLALAAASLLSPAGLMAWVLAGWAIAADLQLTPEFAINHGIFSHWQVWLGTGVTLLLTTAGLNRYGRAGNSIRGNS